MDETDREQDQHKGRWLVKGTYPHVLILLLGLVLVCFRNQFGSAPQSSELGLQLGILESVKS
jgi:hypothetical protein